MLRSLVGSEMCIRDSSKSSPWLYHETVTPPCALWICLLYTSDAADERSSVDLGGRRIIKKKITIFFFQAEDGIRDAQESRGLGDVYKRQLKVFSLALSRNCDSAMRALD